MISELVDKGSFNRVVNYLRKHKRWSVDTETTGLDSWHGDRVCGLVLGSMEPNSPGYYFPIRHATGNNLPMGHYHQLLELLESRDRCTGWNYKFDIHMLMADGLPMPRLGTVEDVMLAAHLMNKNEINFKLKDLSAKYLGDWAKEPERALTAALVEAGLGGKGQMWQLNPSAVRDYAGADVILTRRMRKLYWQGLKDWKLDQIWTEVNDYLLVTVEMERNGITIDPKMTKKFEQEAQRKEKKSHELIKSLVGYDINLNSHPQLKAWLNLPSTAKDVLEAIVEPGPEIEALLKYRAWNKVRTSYYTPWLEKRDEENRIHPSIALHGTVAGRPSCRDPNLQAVPRKTDKGWKKDVYKVKNAVVARPGFTMVSADYSQAELRLGAFVCNDPVMIEILESGRDIHAEAASMMDIERDSAKRINFGAFYGAGAKKLAKERNIAIELAEYDLGKYHDTFKGIKTAYLYTQDQARAKGFIRMWTGRVRRYYSQLNPEHRKALSNIIQGGVSEIMRHALTRIYYEIVSPTGRLKGVKLILQVHDNIIFEIPNAKVKKAIPVIVGIMEDFKQFRPAPKVDVVIGDRWGTLTKWDKENAA